MAKLIKTDGAVLDVSPRDPTRGFQLDELQGYVGGWVEIVDVRTPDGEELLLVMDEEGKIKGLPLNLHAISMTRGRLMPDDFVVGNVLLVHPSEMDEGDDV